MPALTLVILAGDAIFEGNPSLLAICEISSGCPALQFSQSWGFNPTDSNASCANFKGVSFHVFVILDAEMKPQAIRVPTS